MKPNEGRLQTAEHILAKIMEDKISGARIVIAKFTEESGLLEMSAETDLRNLDFEEIQNKVNAVIKKELLVYKSVKKREEAEKEVNLRNVPAFVRDVRIVEIRDFDKRPCKDPYVGNTGEIRFFKILEVKRAGNNRYRFTFKVE